MQLSKRRKNRAFRARETKFNSGEIDEAKQCALEVTDADITPESEDEEEYENEAIQHVLEVTEADITPESEADNRTSGKFTILKPIRKGVKKNELTVCREYNKFEIEEIDEFINYDFAVFLLRKYEIRYLAEEDSILWIFNGKVYVPLPREDLEALIYDELPQLLKEELASCKKIKQQIADIIEDECHPEIIKKATDSKKFAQHHFKHDDLKKIYNRVPLNNGIYDVKRRKMVPFDSSLPYYYIINAKFIEGKNVNQLNTPYFDKLLSDATEGDEDSINMICYVLGMLLMPNKCKKFPVVGPASNSGKSLLFGQFLDRLIDPKRISRVSSSELANKFSLGNAENKLLISCLDMDIDAIPSKAAGMIKRATGEEKISIEAKYQNQHEIVVRFHFLFGTNGCFSPVKYDSGWVNRVIAVPFIHETPEKEQRADLLKLLLEEKDEIVTKVLLKMKDVTGDDGNIVIPESRLSIKLKNEWTAMNTFYQEFCEECICVTGEKDDVLSREDLYEVYKRFFQKRSSAGCDIKNKQLLTVRQLFDKLENQYPLLKYTRVRSIGSDRLKNAVWRYTGIRFKEGIIKRDFNI